MHKPTSGAAFQLSAGVREVHDGSEIRKGATLELGMEPQHFLLLVEDDDDVRNALADLLESEGFRVAQARNGQDALDFLRSHEPPSVILLDLMMPVMDGWTFCEIQQATPELARIPLLVCTAAGNRNLPVTKNRVIKKPIDLPHLLSEIRKLV